jgi:hypothetical protein
LWLAAACGDDKTCPNDLPAACPDPAPSYAQTIAPLISNRCYPCHGPGGVEQAAHDFTSYQGVFDQRTMILDAVYACRMPPGDSPQLSADDRAALLGWLVCHAPNN